MAKKVGVLTAVGVKNIAKPGLHGDGGGLYLQVGPTGAKSWIFRFMQKGRARAMGLGPLHTVTLAEARGAALECRKELLEGRDPIELRKEKRSAPEGSGMPTFMSCAEAYIAAHESGWRNEKHIAQWKASLQNYASPVFGDRPVDEIDLGMIMKVLEPIWSVKTETASRVRGRIESVLDWAAVRGFRKGENPARWRGHLEALLPARGRVKKVKHHAALPYAELPAFVAKLRDLEGAGAKAMLFLILTAARTGEVIGARWSEIDAINKVWTVPADRMKARKEHRVPLRSFALSGA
ncbi:MAG: integrase arm-type DNA-binding domain-containing protein [Sphingomonadales bacterium]|nr:integrase arm-type DNA-binding domain-containing protein [Sphingomonadales bacterium]